MPRCSQQSVDHDEHVHVLGSLSLETLCHKCTALIGECASMLNLSIKTHLCVCVCDDDEICRCHDRFLHVCVVL